MLLAVDVGNTQTVLGLYRDGELADHWRLATERSTTADELGVLLSGLLDFESVSGICLASTVPVLVREWEALARKWADEYPALFEYIPVISDALPEDNWTGRTGFVHRAVIADQPDLSGVQVYACGVPIMVESARRDFTHACGLPIDEFFADSFTTQADLAAG